MRFPRGRKCFFKEVTFGLLYSKVPGYGCKNPWYVRGRARSGWLELTRLGETRDQLEKNQTN